jgi:hypothetical protein
MFHDKVHYLKCCLIRHTENHLSYTNAKIWCKYDNQSKWKGTKRVVFEMVMSTLRFASVRSIHQH